MISCLFSFFKTKLDWFVISKKNKTRLQFMHGGHEIQRLLSMAM